MKDKVAEVKGGTGIYSLYKPGQLIGKKLVNG